MKVFGQASVFSLQQKVLLVNSHCMNIWHDLSIGSEAPQKIQAVIEIPAGSKVKYELDKESGCIKVDRILHSSMIYPANYGFIPQTYCDDQDPLDLLILSQCSFIPMSIVQVIPVGVMKMMDQGEGDDKIIAVHAGDPQWKFYQNITELPKHLIAEIQNFFETYKMLEKKQVTIQQFLGQKEAFQCIQEARQLYQKKFKAPV